MPQKATYTDKEVLLKIRSSQQLNAAVSYLYQTYYGRLETIILRNNGSNEDAQDIIQETMVTFINIVQQGKFRGESGINTFLQAITKNLWLERLRKVKAEHQRHEKWSSAENPNSIDLEAEFQYKEATDTVAGIFKGLSETCQKILHLFYFKDLSMKEILPKMNYENEQVLRNKKSKCMKTLMQKIKANPAWADTMKNALQKLR